MEEPFALGNSATICKTSPTFVLRGESLKKFQANPHEHSFVVCHKCNGFGHFGRCLCTNLDRGDCKLVFLGFSESLTPSATVSFWKLSYGLFKDKFSPILLQYCFLKAAIWLSFDTLICLLIIRLRLCCVCLRSTQPEGSV